MRAHRDAAQHQPVGTLGQQGGTCGRRIFSGQGGQFGLEILKAQIQPQSFGIEAEQMADAVGFRRKAGRADGDGHGATYANRTGPGKGRAGQDGSVLPY